MSEAVDRAADRGEPGTAPQAAGASGAVLLLTLLSFNFGAVFLSRSALGFLVPFAPASLALTNFRIGLLSAALALAWAASGLALAAPVVRSMPRELLVAGLSVLGAASAALSGFAGLFLAFLLTRVALGLFAGPILPLSQGIMAAAAQRWRGFQMGVVQSAGSSLTAIFGPPALVAIAAAEGWRAALLACSAISGAGACLAGYYFRHSRARLHARNAQRAPRDSSFRSLLATANVRRCSIVGVAMVGWLITGLTFYPLCLMHELHLGSAQMGALMALMGAGGFCGGLLIPALSDWIGRRPALVIGALLGVLGPVAVHWPPASTLALEAAFFLSAVAGGTFPLFMGTIPAESLPTAESSAGMGLVQCVAESLGGVAMPLLAGALADRYGFGAALLVIGGCAAAGALAASGVAETLPRSGVTKARS